MVVLEAYHGVDLHSKKIIVWWAFVEFHHYCTGFVTGIFNDVPNTIDWR